MVVRLPTAQHALSSSVCCTLQLFTPCRVLYGEQGRFFEDEIRPHLKHKKKGMVAMAGELPVLLCRKQLLRLYKKQQFWWQAADGVHEAEERGTSCLGHVVPGTKIHRASCFGADGVPATQEACAAC